MGDFYCFQRTLPLERWDAEDDEPTIASNGLLTALRVATGTTLVRYSMADAEEAGLDLSVWATGSAKSTILADKLLTVEDSVDATQMLHEFRAVQWAAIAKLWDAAGHSLPPLLERAAGILGTTPTDWASVRQVEYLGIACGDVVATQAALREAYEFMLDPADPTVLFHSLAVMCDVELHEAAKAADAALILVGRATGLLDEDAAGGWAAKVLHDLNPLRAKVAVARRGSLETKWPRHIR